MTFVSPERRAQARRAMQLEDAALEAECTVDFFAPGGPGGQHANKTASGVRLTHAATELSVTATERRSQAQNRSMAMARLRAALIELTYEPKKRRKTKPTKGSQRRRLESKKKHSQKKAMRKAY